VPKKAGKATEPSFVKGRVQLSFCDAENGGQGGDYPSRSACLALSASMRRYVNLISKIHCWKNRVVDVNAVSAFWVDDFIGFEQRNPASIRSLVNETFCFAARLIPVYR